MSDPIPFDTEAAKTAFKTLHARLLALPAESLAVVSTDVQKASAVAARVGRFVKEPDTRARFAKLPGPNDGGLDQTHVDDLETAALAAWYTTVELLSASAGTTEAKLPVALVDEALAVRKRMLDLLLYYRGDDPIDGPELADIIRGSGYTDLVSDLLRLIKLYIKHADLVKLDTKNYRDTDVARAGEIAHTIIALLGEAKKTDEKTWTDLVARAWTLLNVIYDEVSVPGRWLYRHDRAEERFPSLYAAGRTSSSRSKKVPKGATGTGQGGTGESGQGTGESGQGGTGE